MITVLILIFSKCSPLNFSGKSGLKILLKLSKKIATIVACQFFVFLIRFLKLGYSDNKHKDTVYVLFSDRTASVKK